MAEGAEPLLDGSTHDTYGSAETPGTGSDHAVIERESETQRPDPPSRSNYNCLAKCYDCWASWEQQYQVSNVVSM